MYLKSLTLKGFKSFASATTLRFEPGITAVVGPNGSGKSNVVDAIAWVLGEQGARTLRGGSMSDVIFAGTTGKQALGRAEVSLCIDNSDQAISLPHQEITLTRTMFRGGGSEYAINGAPARLLDVVELLSDAGVGREMHVIVGQNSLDTVLAGTPLDRRGLLEEAAGVLKHRKRKEKALRKLESMQANLVRLHDLTAEVRRQLTPLGRQADAARKAAGLQATWRDASLRLLADDLLQAQESLRACEAAEQHARSHRETTEREIAVLRERELHATQQLATLQEQAQQLGNRASQANAITQRYHTTVAVAQERYHTCTQLLAATGEQTGDPQQLVAEVEQAQAREQSLREQLAREERDLQEAVEQREQSEQALTAASRGREEHARAVAAAQQARTRWAGELAALRSRIESREQELTRLQEAVVQAQAAQQANSTGGQESDQELAQLQAQLEQARAQQQQAQQLHEQARQATSTARAQQQQAQQHLTAALAQVQALRLALAGQAQADHLDLPEQAGPPLAELIEVDSGDEVALDAALARVASAITVPSRQVAVQALTAASQQEAAALFLLTQVQSRQPGLPQHLPAAVRPARAAVRPTAGAPSGLAQVLDHLLAAVVLAPDLNAAVEAVAGNPALTAVTAQGQVVDATTVSTGPQQVSVVQMRAQLTQAQAQAEQAQAPLAQAQLGLAQAEAQHEQTQQEVARTQQQAHHVQTQVAALTERATQAQRAAAAAATALARAQASYDKAAAALHADQLRLPQVQAQQAHLPNPQELPEHLRPEVVATLEVQASSARQQEMAARLSVRTTQERLQVEQRRLAAARQRATAQQQASTAWARRRQQARQQQAVAEQVLQLAEQGLVVVQHLATQAMGQAEQVQACLSQQAAQVSLLRQQWDQLSTQADQLRSDEGSGEVALAQARMRVERLHERAGEEFAVDPHVLIQEYGPDQPVPAEVGEEQTAESGDGEQPATTGYVRAVQEKRRRVAEKALKVLGTVNPLALEEFAAMQERHRFLSEQLADLNATRKDLLHLVEEVDERVRDIFACAFADTAAAFEQVFARLFPGGEGRLILTDPDDLTISGIEVHARPPGKKVKRLSLLSGGERSLTALAFLVALFQARPSPFYVLDEVEAALDDVNLGRLIGLLEDLRESSQLIIITHQKRTMEISDALYGVTMRGDGISTVIGQRLRHVGAA